MSIVNDRACTPGIILNTSSVIRVGDGRGFVADGGQDKLVITAGHCLPFMPPCMNFSYLEERTYKRLLGPIGGETSIWAECLFVDPISDLAVLGPPDSQVLSDQFTHIMRSCSSLSPRSWSPIFLMDRPVGRCLSDVSGSIAG
jgi:hypothetical protein